MFMDPKYYKDNPIVFESDVEEAMTDDITNLLIDQTRFNQQFLGETIEKCEVVNDTLSKRVMEINLTMKNGTRIQIKGQMEVTVVS